MGNCKSFRASYFSWEATIHISSDYYTTISMYLLIEIIEAYPYTMPSELYWGIFFFFFLGGGGGFGCPNITLSCCLRLCI